MSKSLDNGALTIREPYDRIFRLALLVSTAINLAVVLGWIAAEFFGSSPSNLELIAAVIAMSGSTSIVIAYGSWRAHLELRINDKRITVWVWPFRLTSIPVAQVLSSEVVKINPIRDCGRWGLKGTRRDKLIGGGGTTAVRITYTHKSGEERKLTFLTGQAEEAERRIAPEPSQ